MTTYSLSGCSALCLSSDSHASIFLMKAMKSSGAASDAIQRFGDGVRRAVGRPSVVFTVVQMVDHSPRTRPCLEQLINLWTRSTDSNNTQGGRKHRSHGPRRLSKGSVFSSLHSGAWKARVGEDKIVSNMYNSLFRSAPYKFLTDDRFRAANYACRFRPLPAATDAYNTDINVDRLGGLGYPEAIVTATYNIISECVVRERNVLFYFATHITFKDSSYLEREQNKSYRLRLERCSSRYM
ncbi:hypothetical protein KC343_g5 [Hortaea werneckii]|nr:hypothetical protein KC317_g5 [Hortaea werneckii]KAI7628717.1 hypothetical protein KC346_g5 [Hortaea werneckii]KAI7638513.1 hypothetical protein KC343_g5 [Hortaea werneckii]